MKDNDEINNNWPNNKESNLAGSADVISRTVEEQKRLQNELHNLAQQIKHIPACKLPADDLKENLRMITATITKSQAEQITGLQNLQNSIGKAVINANEAKLNHCPLEMLYPLRSDFSRLTQSNCYIWAFENFSEREKESIDHWSQPFYTSYIGYRFKAKLSFEKSLGIYVKLVKGKYDTWMAWPFNKLIAMTILNQVDESESITRILKPEPTDHDELTIWLQPEDDGDSRIGWGIENFLPMNIITGGPTYGSDYLRNDCIYVRFKLVD